MFLARKVLAIWCSEKELWELRSVALRITASTNAQRAKSYFKDSLAREDYYTADREVIGRWGGTLAERLGLSGEVDAEEYFSVVDNIDPRTGESLTPRTRENRRVGYDFTFSVPKSVSVHQGLLGSEELEGAFEGAVSDTMKALEQDMYTRVRKGGAFRDRATGNMMWAGFTHFTSRPVEGKGADPHLHKHVFVFNATFDPEEGEIKAGEFNELHLKRPYWEAVFHVHLAGRIRELGYGVERTKHNFEITGYDRETIEKFAQRTLQIERAAQQKGIVDAESKARLGAMTRAGKAKGTTVSEHRSQWRDRLTESEWASIQLIESNRGQNDGEELPLETVIGRAIEDRFERNSVVKRHEFLTSVLKSGVAHNSVAQAHAQVESAAEQGELILAEWDGRECVTTTEVQREEDRMLAFARETQGTEAAFVPAGSSPVVGKNGRPLPVDLAAAAEKILESRDQVTMMIGKPGTGKTTVMRTVVDAIEAQGREVYAFAPSAVASREKQVEAGFGNAETLAMLLQNDKLQEEIRGQVIWIDEAGMVGARDMAQVFDLAKERNARLILTGDPNQHKPVVRGDAMRILEDFAQLDVARLDIIKRQTEAKYLEATTAISDGRIREGFDCLVEANAVHEIEDWEERYSQIADDYVHHKLDRRRSVLVVSPTHQERNEASAEIRSRLLERDVIDSIDQREFDQLENRSLQVSEKRDPVSYGVGETVKFHKAARGFSAGTGGPVSRVENGTVWIERDDGSAAELPLEHAERFDVFDQTKIVLAAGDEVRITRNGLAKSCDSNGRKQRLSNGRIYGIAGFTVEGDLRLNNGFVVDKKYANLTYGYAVTSHGSQSLDQDVVLIAQGHASFPASNAEQFLVSTTRGKEAAHIYTDDRAGLLDAVQRSGERPSATELLAEKRSDEAASAAPSRIAVLRNWVMELVTRYRDRVAEVEEDREQRTDIVKPERDGRPDFSRNDLERS